MIECPNCKQEAHPAMAKRYEGCCSQICEEIMDNCRLEEDNENLRAQVERLEAENTRLQNIASQNAEQCRSWSETHNKRMDQIEELEEDRHSFAHALDHIEDHYRMSTVLTEDKYREYTCHLKKKENQE